jgi:hypothetical protein
MRPKDCPANNKLKLYLILHGKCPGVRNRASICFTSNLAAACFMCPHIEKISAIEDNLRQILDIDSQVIIK